MWRADTGWRRGWLRCASLTHSLSRHRAIFISMNKPFRAFVSLSINNRHFVLNTTFVDGPAHTHARVSAKRFVNRWCGCWTVSIRWKKSILKLNSFSSWISIVRIHFDWADDLSRQKHTQIATPLHCFALAERFGGYSSIKMLAERPKGALAIPSVKDAPEIRVSAFHQTERTLVGEINWHVSGVSIQFAFAHTTHTYEINSISR